MTNKKIHPRAEFVSKFIRSSFSKLLVLRCPVRPVRTPSMAGFLTSSKRCRGPGIEIWLPAGVSEEGDNAAIDLQVSVPPQPGQKYRGRQKCRPLAVAVQLDVSAIRSRMAARNAELPFLQRIRAHWRAHGAPQLSGFTFSNSDWWGRDSLLHLSIRNPIFTIFSMRCQPMLV
jgi:hypothetical protein